MNINILGTKYQLVNQNEEENPKMKDCSGLCEAYAKKIIIDTTPMQDPESLDNIDGYFHRVLRHEAFHAIFHETGWSKYHEDEDLVELLAILYPRIREIMDALDTMDIRKI